MSSIPQNKKNENEISDFVTKFGPMSILWTKKVERLCCFF